MRSVVACVSLLIAGCGPVLLVGDAPSAGGTATVRDLDAAVGDVPRIDAAISVTGPDAAILTSNPRDGTSPRALLSVTSSDCGRCFNLVADAVGGLQPYQFQWDDGSRSPTRRVCVEGIDRKKVTVVVQDANAKSSAPSVTELIPDDTDAACPPAQPRGRKLCVQNPSFEGTPAINVGQNFDAIGWSTCSNDSSSSNTPDVGSDALAVFGSAPKAVNGQSYLVLTQGEQASQILCEPVQGGESVSFQLQVSRVELAPGDTTKVFLEVWGGIGADCSQRQLLWASPALASSWTPYCVTLKPVEYINQITLRSKTDMASLAPEVMVVDNIVPVDECP